MEVAAVPDLCVGEYELRPDMSLTISKADDQLFFQLPGQTALKLVKQSDMTYEFAYMDDTITFVKNGQGNVQALILRQGTAEMVALKKHHQIP